MVACVQGVAVARIVLDVFGSRAMRWRTSGTPNREGASGPSGPTRSLGEMNRHGWIGGPVLATQASGR